MLVEMNSVGVDRVVIVPPAIVGYQNATALEAAARYPDRFAVMGLLNPAADTARAELAVWLNQPGMLGVRMSSGGGNPVIFSGSYDDPEIAWFWNDCERLDIPVMVNVWGEPNRVATVAQQHPALTLIIDHMGAIGGASSAAAAFGRIDDLLALARNPRVYVKLTSAPSYSHEPYPHPDLHPYLHRMYDAFGPRRLMWGSDFTRLEGSYQHCLDLFRESLEFLSQDDNNWILGRSCATALRWQLS